MFLWNCKYFYNFLIAKQYIGKHVGLVEHLRKISVSQHHGFWFFDKRYTIGSWTEKQ